MKKFIIGMFSLLLSTTGVIFAWDINTQYVGNYNKPICNDAESKTIDVYMTGDSYIINPYDSFWHENDVVLNSKTSVQIWSGGIIFDCNDWIGMSTYIKGGHPSNENDRALVLRTSKDRCTLHRPNTPRNDTTSVNAIIHYTIGYKKVGGSTPVPNPWYYRTVGNTNFKCISSNGSTYTPSNNDTSNCTPFTVNIDNTQRYHTGECLKYRVFWCGDGIRDHSREDCDPKHPAWTNGNDGWTCDNQCKQHYNPVPECASTYNGKVVDTITGGNHLCSKGTYDTNSLDKNSDYIWTWTCSGNGSKSCSAMQKGEFDINKELISPRYVSSIGQQVQWKIVLTGKNGYLENLLIKDELPEELSYVSSSNETPLPDRISIPGDQPKVNGKIVTWQTSGKLKPGKPIILYVNTKVEKMPDMTGHKNTACAWMTGMNRKCDYEPIPGTKEGEPAIKKTLKNAIPVSHTGQAIDWKVKVTASGGSITDFEIYDKLPVELDYTGFYVEEKPSGITVNYSKRNPNPVPSGKVNIHYWDVTGTLQEGQSIVMTVKSTVKKMPSSGEIKNIACVKDDGKTICDDEPLPATCNSLYSGGTFETLTESNDLCQVGEVGHFEFHTGDNKWTWTCSNEASTKSCYAFKKTTPKGAIKPDKILITTNEIKSVGQNVVWKLTAKAVGGDVENVTIRDYLPSILSYDSEILTGRKLSGVHMKSGQPTTGSDSTGKYVQWETTGTLTKGQTIELLINTKVNKMPETGKQYKNVECATTGNKTIWICDPEPLSGQCKSDFKGKTFETLTASNDLCQVGVVGDFEFHTGDNKWTWTCNNYSSEVDCFAYKSTEKVGTGIIKKTLTKKVEVEYTGQKLIWEIKVTASGGNITNFEIWDKMPKELTYDNKFEITGEIQPGITIEYSKRNPNPEPSGNVNIHYWDASGTLKEGKTITMLIETHVNRVPKAGEKIKNIACVVKNNKTRSCDDDEPPTPTTKKGELVIKKTLNPKVEVTTTGQKLTWDIVVTASGGAVTGGFKISDIVPFALEFTGVYSIKDNKAGLKMGKWYTGSKSELNTWEGETLTGEIWTLDVSGSMASGDYLKLQITTRVKKMPKNNNEYRNVACVIKEGKVDCDDDEPPTPTTKKGELVIKKTLNPKVEVTTTGQKLTWDIVVTASGGAVTGGFKISDIVPFALEFTGVYSIKDNKAGLKMGKWYTGNKSELNTWEGETLTGEIWTLDVSGSMASGDYLKLQITTRVKKMPKNNDEYRNVACVIKDGEIDCDDDKPTPTSGKLVIEKILTGTQTVDHTGQNLKWQIRVTASGGDVAGGFKISDIVPFVLEFTGVYDVNYNPAKLTMGKWDNKSAPSELKTWEDGTLTGEIWTLDVSGNGLKQNQSLVLTITTRVKKMPKNNDEYRNVACVIKDGEIDCDDDKPTPKGGYLEVTKTLVGPITYVTGVNQILQWDIKVRAKNGDVKMKHIRDELPNELGYKDYKVIYTGYGISIDKPKLSSGGKVITWPTKGTLQSGDYIKLRLYTKVEKLPNGEVVNVACAAGPEPEPCGSGSTTALRIKKQIWNPNKGSNGDWDKSMTGNIGDTITYKIDFGNIGDTGAYVMLKDFLPKDIQVTASSLYVDSREINGLNHTLSTGSESTVPYTGRWERVDGVYINAYQGIYLRKNTKGVMVITGTAIHSEDSEHNRTNFACIYKEESNSVEKIACDDAIYNVEEILCGKPRIDTKILTGRGSTNVVCKTSGGKADIEIDCGNGSKNVSKKGVSSLTGTCTYEWNKNEGNIHEVKCIVNNKTDDKKCVDTVTVKESEKNVQCESLIVEPDSLSYKGGDVEVTCKTTNGENANISIDCGNKDKFSKSDASSYTETCKYPRNDNDSSIDYSVKCIINDSDDGKCQDTVTVKGHTPTDDRKCKGIDVDYHGSNGQIEVTCNANDEVYFKLVGCDDGAKVYNKELKKSHTFTCDNIKEKELTCYTTKGNGFSTTNPDYICEYEDDGPGPGPNQINPVQTCINVNAGNFSIEEGEILPFYWNLRRLDNIVDKRAPYYEIDGSYNNAEDILNDKEGDTCPRDGVIASDSMVCTFKIYDGGDYFRGMKNGNLKDVPLYVLTGPCLSKNIDMTPLLSNRYDEMNNRYCNGEDECMGLELARNGIRPTDDRFDEFSGSLYSSVYYINNFGEANIALPTTRRNNKISVSSSMDNNHRRSYGEYKILIDNLEYLQCVDGNWEKRNGDVAACQNNFMLTNSYTVQKTPSGNIKASTETLERYLDIEGKGQNFAKYLDAIAATAYKPNANVNEAMKTFTDKYKKLAVKVTSNTSTDYTMYKVPGKSIYFVDGNIKIDGEKTVTKPYTMVVSGTATVIGNVKNNMMLLASKNIIFSGDCNSIQKVKGIYYASGDLKRTGIQKNVEESTKWCSEGGLHIQGVLIGNNFEELMKASRSNINGWFLIKNDASKKDERRKMIMNGASVLIEYSPSIFTKSTMPPGAEDFTTALSIYRQ